MGNGDDFIKIYCRSLEEIAYGILGKTWEARETVMDALCRVCRRNPSGSADSEEMAHLVAVLAENRHRFGAARNRIPHPGVLRRNRPSCKL